jgi:hypothetical protein
MQRVVAALHIATRVLSILAALALLFTLWGVSAIMAFTCFDSCDTPGRYFPRMFPNALVLLTPCAVFATLALLVFLVYCRTTRQPWRALITLLYFLVTGLVGVATLNAHVQYGRATVAVDPEGGLLVEDSIMEWANQWAGTVLLLGAMWAGGLAGLEWGARWRRQSQPAPSQSATV